MANITLLYDIDKNRIQVAEHGSHKEKQKTLLLHETQEQNADIVFKEEEQWMSGLTPETFCHLFLGETLQAAQYVEH